MMHKLDIHNESVLNSEKTSDPNAVPQKKKELTQRQKRLATALRQNLSKRKTQQRERISEITHPDSHGLRINAF